LEGVGGGLPSGSGSSLPDPDPSQQSQQAKPRARKSNAQASAAFDRFWLIYPRKVARKPAIKAWISNGCDARADEVIAALSAQLPMFAAREIDRVPHAASWLNAERWRDEIEAPRQGAVKAAPESFQARDEREARERRERERAALDRQVRATEDQFRSCELHVYGPAPHRKCNPRCPSWKGMQANG
jgi:hypothetical protein